MFDEDDDVNGDDNSDGINMLQSISIVVEEGGIVNVNC